jgi:hypothetical protein
VSSSSSSYCGVVFALLVCGAVKGNVQMAINPVDGEQQQQQLGVWRCVFACVVAVQ